MDAPELTPAVVQQTLRLLAGLEIDAAEATALLPWLQAQRDALATLDQFDVGEVRSAVGLDAAAPYR
ncbi:MAG TPA: hypothetical protein VK066_07000 [Chloroflexota bacterium]|nr:hypothetical protein [Chloroflexota bacterium]